MINELELALLIKNINQAHLNYEAVLKSAVQHAINTGQLLLEARAQCQPGEWHKWLSDHVIFSKSTAHGYMKAASALPTLEGGQVQHVMDLSLRETLALLAELTAPELTVTEQEASGYEGKINLLIELTQRPLRQVQEILAKFQEVEILLGDKFHAWLYLEHKRTQQDYEALKVAASTKHLDDEQLLEILWKWYGGQEAQLRNT